MNDIAQTKRCINLSGSAEILIRGQKMQSPDYVVTRAMQRQILHRGPME